jgi:hypothetical protein
MKSVKSWKNMLLTQMSARNHHQTIKRIESIQISKYKMNGLKILEIVNENSVQ